MARSDLPFGSEFSPAQIDLANLLELAHKHGPDWKAFENAVRERYFSANRTTDYNKSKLANNTKLSLRSYGLIGQRDTTLSEAGEALYAVRGDERLLYERFARHILKHCQGMNFVQCILDLHAAAEKIDLNKLRSYVATRLRGSMTGGAEVDLIFESARLVFSRWQVQCKNTARVSLDDVAKEVGLTHLLHSNVVVMVSTGRIGGEARRYANKIMAESNLCIVMIDGDDLDRIEARPAQVVDVFNRESGHAMALKKLERQEIER